MDDRDGTKVVQQYIDEAWGHGNIAAIDELCAPSFVVHAIPPPPDPPADAAYLKQIVTIMHSAFADVDVVVRTMSVNEGLVKTEVRFSGSHRGYFAGNPPTSKWVNVHC